MLFKVLLVLSLIFISGTPLSWAQNEQDQVAEQCAGLENLLPQSSTRLILACVEREGDGDFQGRAGDWSLTVERNILEPGESIPPQLTTEDTRELIYVEQGDLTLFHLADGGEQSYSQGEQTFLVHADIDYVGNSSYAIRNDGNMTLSMLRLTWSPPAAAADGGFDAFPSLGTSETSVLANMIVRSNFLPVGPTAGFIARIEASPDSDLGTLVYSGPTLQIVEEGVLEVGVKEVHPEATEDLYPLNLSVPMIAGEAAWIEIGEYFVVPSLTTHHLVNPSDQPTTLLMVGLIPLEHAT